MVSRRATPDQRQWQDPAHLAAIPHAHDTIPEWCHRRAGDAVLLRRRRNAHAQCSPRNGRRRQLVLVLPTDTVGDQ